MPEIIVPGIGKDNGKDDASAAEIGALKTLLPQTAGILDLGLILT